MAGRVRRRERIKRGDRGATIPITARYALALLGAASIVAITRPATAQVTDLGDGNFEVSGNFVPDLPYVANGGADLAPTINVDSTTNVEYTSFNNFFQIDAGNYTVNVESGAFIKNNATTSIFTTSEAGARTVYNIAGELESFGPIISSFAIVDPNPSWDITLSGTLRSTSVNAILLGQAGNDRLVMEAGSLIQSGNGSIQFRAGNDELIYNGGTFDGLNAIFFQEGNDLLELNASPTGMPRMLGGDGTDTVRLNNSGTVSLTALESGWEILEMEGVDWTLSGTTGNTFADAVRLNSGTLTLEVTGGDMSIAGDITGSGNFVKDGASALALSGDGSAFTGTTAVAGGTLAVMNALGGDISVSAGLLTGAGVLGSAGTSVEIAAGGIHTPGDGTPSGSQVVAGDYVNNGTLVIYGTPSGTSRLIVDGTIDITGAALDLDLSPNNAPDWSPTNGPFVIVENRGVAGVTGTFSPVNDLNNLLFLDHDLDYSHDVTLTLTRNDTSLSSATATPNQAATASAIDTLPAGNPLSNAILMMTDEGTLQAALDTLSGEVHATFATALMANSQIAASAAGNRIRAAFASVGAPTSVPVLAYGPGGPLPAPADTERAAVWGTAFGSWANYDGNANAAGFDADTAGLIAGADAPVGDWRIGALAGYSRTNVDVAARASSGTADSFHLGVYGGTQWGNLGLRTGLSYTWHDIRDEPARQAPAAFPIA